MFMIHNNNISDSTTTTTTQPVIERIIPLPSVLIGNKTKKEYYM